MPSFLSNPSHHRTTIDCADPPVFVAAGKGNLDILQILLADRRTRLDFTVLFVYALSIASSLFLYYRSRISVAAGNFRRQPKCEICSVGTPCLMSNAGQTRRYLTFPTTVLTATTSCKEIIGNERNFTRRSKHKIIYSRNFLSSDTTRKTNSCSDEKQHFSWVTLWHRNVLKLFCYLKLS